MCHRNVLSCSVLIVDGDLSHKEFIKVMKSRTTRGLEKVQLCSETSICSFG